MRTSLQEIVSGFVLCVPLSTARPGASVPFPKPREATPEHDRQRSHEECMCAQVRCDGKVAIEGRSAQLVLEVGKIRRLPPHERQKSLSQRVPPLWECSSVYSQRQFSSSLASACGVLGATMGEGWASRVGSFATRQIIHSTRPQLPARRHITRRTNVQ